MKIRSSELIGSQLDMMVAAAVGAHAVETGSDQLTGGKHWAIDGFQPMRWDDWTPSRDWEQAGKLIDRFYPTFSFVEGLIRCEIIVASGEHFRSIAPDYLTSFCRAVVVARLGEEVDIAEE